MPKRRRHDSLLIEDETLSKIENTSDDVEASNTVYTVMFSKSFVIFVIYLLNFLFIIMFVCFHI
jgi:hypothetical protein